VRSIERSLLAWILGALTLGSLLVALVTYLVTLEEMNEVFDADLRNVAEAVASYRHSGNGNAAQAVPLLPQRTDMADDDEIVTLSWTRAGQRVYASDPRIRIPYSNVEGLSRARVEGEDWIVYSSVRSDGVAQAAQRVASRQEIAGESATRIFPPMMVLALIVGGLLVFGLRRGLQPLDSAARDIAAKSAMTLNPIEASDVPREIVPLVASINGLIGRLAAAFSAQRRFLADAAHELRTPVTALRLQLQLLRRSTDDASREEALAELEAGIVRSQRLIEQLLHVARSEPDGEITRKEPVELGRLARTVVGKLSVQAEQRGIDLGAAAPAQVLMQGDKDQLTVLLNNLVENALRYTPSGGVVDVEVGLRDGRSELRVIDNGPGIPEAERKHVFDRFFRGEGAAALARDAGGSGLGLAIVRAIAERHGAVVSLHTPRSGRGLEVRIAFPGSAAG
jgi:two-component system, OmpR family, sensor kinase